MLNSLLTITNATKSQIITAINSIFGILIAFNLVFTQTQMGAIDIAVNAFLSLLVGVTYGKSSMRRATPKP